MSINKHSPLMIPTFTLSSVSYSVNQRCDNFTEMYKANKNSFSRNINMKDVCTEEPKQIVFTAINSLALILCSPVL